MLNSGISPPSGVKLSCMALTAPHEASVVIDGEQRGGGDAEAHLLAFHVAAGSRPSALTRIGLAWASAQ